MRTGIVAVALAVAMVAAPRVRAQVESDEGQARTAAERDKREREEDLRERERDRADEKAEREEELYDRATEALDEERWERAVEAFDGVATAGGRRADAGLYWKAYAQRKAGRAADALATLAQLRKTAPQSKYLKEADGLEQEIRQSSGQRPSPEKESDEDLKLMALNALLTSNSDQAVPMLEKFLASGAAPK